MALANQPSKLQSFFFLLEAVTGFYGISTKRKREIILTQNRVKNFED